MRKICCILITALLISLLCSCGSEGLVSASPYPSGNVSVASSVSPSDITGNTAAPSPAPTAGVKVDNKARFNIFRTFLSDNYQELSDTFFNGISGIGFIDLDMDGAIELLIFDAGASASMGLQFFDIVDSRVECVSANMDAVGKAFGGEHFGSVRVNANYFDDFRLMGDKKTGEKFYIVESGNGAADFSYSELIRFGNDDDILTLTSLMYKHEDYDIDSGAVKSESFELAGKDTDKAKYTAAYSAFFANAEDTGFEAKGVFQWENDEYANGLDGLLLMADNAFSLYEDEENS